MSEFKDFRVLYQYNNPERTDPTGRLLSLAEGPQFRFDTVLAIDEDSAAEECAYAHRADDDFSVVQVIPSNGKATGFGATRSGDEPDHV